MIYKLTTTPFEQKEGLFIAKDNANDGRIVVLANSVQKFISGVDKALPAVKGNHTLQAKDRDYNFFDSWEDTMKTFVDNPYSLVDFQEVEQTVEMPAEAKPDLQMDVTGDFIDIGLFVDGEPEHWGYLPYTNPSRIFCTITLSFSIVWNVKVEVLKKRARYIMGLVNWLESMDIRTRIIGIHPTDCAYIEVAIKNYDEPLDIAAIAVASNPDFTRRICHRVMEHSTTWHSGYGMCTKVNTHADGDISVIVRTEGLDNGETIETFFERVVAAIVSGLNQNQRAFEVN